VRTGSTGALLEEEKGPSRRYRGFPGPNVGRRRAVGSRERVHRCAGASAGISRLQVPSGKAIAAVTWEALNRDGDRWTLRLHAKNAKTGHGRALALEGPLRAVIKHRLAARRLDCSLIFHRDGEPIREFRKAWASALKRASLPEPCSTATTSSRRTTCETPCSRPRLTSRRSRKSARSPRCRLTWLLEN
jgi:hypothetical protein